MSCKKSECVEKCHANEIKEESKLFNDIRAFPEVLLDVHYRIKKFNILKKVSFDVECVKLRISLPSST